MMARSSPGKVARLALVAVFLILTRLTLNAQDAGQQQLPDPAAVDKALSVMNEVYKDRYAKATTATAQAALAKSFLELGQASEDDAERWVIFRESARLAIQGGDTKAALAAIDALADRFAVDVWDLRLKSLTRLGETSKTSEQSKALTEASLGFIGIAIDEDDYELGVALLEIARKAAARCRDAVVQKQVAAFDADFPLLKRNWELANVAFETLKKTPEDTTANLIWGKYLCYFKNNWKEGLDFLARGGADPLADLARQESKAQLSSEEQLKIADGWWEIADTQEPIAQRSIQAHAVAFYRQSLPTLTGLSKAKAQSRVDSVSQAPSSASTASETRRASSRKPSFWFGHQIEESPEHTKNIASHANLILDSGWPSHGDAVIKVAREHNLMVVLLLLSQNAAAEEAAAVSLAKANPDVVVGICLNTPYYSGLNPDAVAEFARRIKKSAPGIEAWAAFVEKPRGKDQTYPVPPEIDVLIVSFFYDNTPQAVQLKANACLRNWMQKAGGRPVLLRWVTASGDPPGLVPQTLTGTMQTYATIAKNLRLSGLILGHYGGNKGYVGLDTSPALQKEVKDIYESLRIRRSR